MKLVGRSSRQHKTAALCQKASLLGWQSRIMGMIRSPNEIKYPVTSRRTSNCSTRTAQTARTTWTARTARRRLNRTDGGHRASTFYQKRDDDALSTTTKDKCAGTPSIEKSSPDTKRRRGGNNGDNRPVSSRSPGFFDGRERNFHVPRKFEYQSHPVPDLNARSDRADKSARFALGVDTHWNFRNVFTLPGLTWLT